MICKKCGKYHPPLEPCYYDLPHNIIIRQSATELAHASDKSIADELRRRGLTTLPHPNPDSPDYVLPVLATKHLSDQRRQDWREFCLEVLSRDDAQVIAN